MDVESVNKNIYRWGEDEVKVSKLMPRYFNNQLNPTALHLQGRSTRNTPSSSSSCGSELIDLDLMELGREQCLSSVREKYLDLKTGEVYYLSSEEAIERSSEFFPDQENSNFSSIEEEEEEGGVDLTMSLSTSKIVKSGIKNNDHSAAEEEAESVMKLVGCHTCLMYFMVSGQDLRCPKCKGSSLLDFLDRD